MGKQDIHTYFCWGNLSVGKLPFKEQRDGRITRILGKWVLKM
jgi:hypothetical protein